MARNVEKGKSMLNQWIKAKEIPDKREFFKIPKNIDEVENLDDALKYRIYIIKEMCKKIKEIQNHSLSDQHIRELNDQINKLIFIKNKWEARIVQLGGKDYSRESNLLISAHSSELRGSNNYKYFGAAKNLKGVKELLFKENEDKKQINSKRKKDARNFEKIVNIHYFGYCDDTNEHLEQQENKMQKKLEKMDLKTLKKYKH
ncbi:pre-mRNA-splicing factor ISY1, putative [Plasmodium sp. gorilla clade G2]|uniref:pre-mRNA-splicing factor ISY1, putative n=1 Tax=Plasmodium sp. gorilla clade G2 TaxID=880535 RepID=UPI000D226999|nr:pre-mRNA-splicing factor ISY1, putative [Plasmodium sp. gorilla clade G2]SOV19930.1 pre-mRNA-splicing factor ISY1, putative [Plasmodium sp. gorilla clade G2]